MITRTALSVSLCLALALARPAPAHAGAADSSAAAQLFDDARGLMEQGEYTPACPKLEASQRLDPQLGTLLHLGHCYEKSGQLAAAYRTFQAAAELAARKGEEGKPEPRETLARERADSLAARLSLLEVRPSEPAQGLMITLDGAPIARAQWNNLIAVEPGDHVLRASAPGRTSWQQTFAIGAPARLGIGVPALAPEAPSALLPSAAAPPPSAPPTASASAPVQRILGYVALGAGVAGLGLGTVFGVLRTARLSALEPACDLDRGRCIVASGDDASRARIESFHNQAGTYASGANLAWILGGVAAAGGLVLILTAPSEEMPAITLGIAPSGLSLTARTDAL